jgi:hypothetical protein
MTSYDEVALDAAGKAVDALRAKGIPVHFDSTVKGIGWGYHLFGGIDDPCA